MNLTFSEYGYKDQTIIDAINMGQWKHSWHLPKTESGRINWSHPDTIAKCHEVITEKIDQKSREISELKHAREFLKEKEGDQQEQNKEEENDSSTT